MTREEKVNLLNELLEIEEKNDIGNLTMADRREFQEWVIKALEQEPCDDMTIAYLMGYYADKEPCDKCVYSTRDGYCQYDDIAETIPPLEPCTDSVSRQAVLKAVDFYDGLNQQHFTVENLREDIDKLPSVRPQEQTGHWIMNRQLERRTCDNCNKEYRWSFYPHNYCPNCGARMVEQESE